MILVDTNVVSEFMRVEVDPAVLAWAQGLGPHETALSAVTVQEVELGIRRLPDGARQRRLRAVWIELLAQYESAVVAYGRQAAEATTSILAEAIGRGRAMSLADAQIAGTCLAEGFTLATRNVKDFSHEPRLTVVDPFAARS